MLRVVTKLKELWGVDEQELNISNTFCNLKRKKCVDKFECPPLLSLVYVMLVFP
jgi:hypothetical protein